MRFTDFQHSGKNRHIDSVVRLNEGDQRMITSYERPISWARDQSVVSLTWETNDQQTHCSKLWWYHNIDKEWKNLLTPFLRIKCLVEISNVVLEKKIFKSRQYIFTLLLLHVSPLGKRRGPSFDQNWSAFDCYNRYS